MKNLLEVRAQIYNHFHSSSAGPAYFFQPGQSDAFVAYYTSMYLIQDTGEAVMAHMDGGFAPDPMRAYIEFWGVTQAIFIQQDAICELHAVIVESRLKMKPESAWRRLREFRNLCAGHPAKHVKGVPRPQRTFMRRSFGNYDCMTYALSDGTTIFPTHPVVNLRQMINDYDLEASDTLRTVLSTMKSRWP